MLIPLCNISSSFCPMTSSPNVDISPLPMLYDVCGFPIEPGFARRLSGFEFLEQALWQLYRKGSMHHLRCLRGRWGHQTCFGLLRCIASGGLDHPWDELCRTISQRTELCSSSLLGCGVWQWEESDLCLPGLQLYFKLSLIWFALWSVFHRNRCKLPKLPRTSIRYNAICRDFECTQKLTTIRLGLTHHANKSSGWARHSSTINRMTGSQMQKNVHKNTIFCLWS